MLVDFEQAISSFCDFERAISSFGDFEQANVCFDSAGAAFSSSRKSPQGTETRIQAERFPMLAAKEVISSPVCMYVCMYVCM